jgi:hypothetical protein
MKPKMQHQVQPRDIVPSRGAQIRIVQGEVEDEIRDFLRAVNSYSARVAKEPRVSFQQHLSSIFAARNNNEDVPERRGPGLRRH